MPGKFKAVKATGWYIDEYGQAQVTLNLTNYKISPLHLIYEEIKKEAEAIGVSVTGSELVGLIPREAMLEVRASNHIAQALYKDYGFEVVHRRPRYYRDNNEDALLMNLNNLDDVKLKREKI